MEDKLLELGFEKVSTRFIGRIIEDKWFQYVKEENKLHIFRSKGLGFENCPYKTITENILEYVKKHLGYINLPGKVQTNEHGVNVIVQTELSTNMHLHHSNKPVIITKILDRREVELEAEKVIQRLKRGTEEDWAKLLKIYANILKYEEGFAISQCSTSIKKIEGIVHGYDDIMKYELKE